MSLIAGIFAYHYAANPVDLSSVKRICANDGAEAETVRHEAFWLSESERAGLGGSAATRTVGGSAPPVLIYDGAIAVMLAAGLGDPQEPASSGPNGQEANSLRERAMALAEAYRTREEAVLGAIEAPFVAALFDTRLNRLLLARGAQCDRTLFLADDGWTVRFASDLAALTAEVSGRRDSGHAMVGRLVREIGRGEVVAVDEVGPRLVARTSSPSGPAARQNELMPRHPEAEAPSILNALKWPFVSSPS